jgi:hypothetical protein
MKKFKIVIEQIAREEHEMFLEGASSIEALDQARALVVSRNKTCPKGTIYSVKKVEEVDNG